MGSYEDRMVARRTMEMAQALTAAGCTVITNDGERGQVIADYEGGAGGSTEIHVTVHEDMYELNTTETIGLPPQECETLDDVLAALGLNSEAR